MGKRELYSRIRDIFSDVDGVYVYPSHGSKFYFRVYLTEKLENTAIDVLELSVRSYNCLKRAGIDTIGELCLRIYDRGDLHSIRNCGRNSVAEIMDNLFAYHYSQLRPEYKARYLEEVAEYNRKITSR